MNFGHNFRETKKNLENLRHGFCPEHPHLGDSNTISPKSSWIGGYTWFFGKVLSCCDRWQTASQTKQPSSKGTNSSLFLNSFVVNGSNIIISWVVLQPSSTKNTHEQYFVNLSMIDSLDLEELVPIHSLPICIKYMSRVERRGARLKNWRRNGEFLMHYIVHCWRSFLQ
jgi:hypothetical protein